MGCINFIMQMDPEMLANYPEDARSLVASRPVWSTVAFAVAVFGGAVGDIVLLLRKAFAFYIFIASFSGAIITNIHTYQASSDINIWIGSFISIVVAIFLIWYTNIVKRKNWIK